MSAIPGPVPDVAKKAKLPGRAYFVPIADDRAHQAPENLGDEESARVAAKEENG